MNYQNLLLYLMIGLAIITLIDTLGAIASRKFQINYAYLSILSLAFYVLAGFIISTAFGFKRVIMINGLLGLYDGTIGFWLSVKLKAKTGLPPEKMEEMMGPKAAIPMVLIAIILGFAGSGLSQL